MNKFNTKHLTAINFQVFLKYVRMYYSMLLELQLDRMAHTWN